MIAGFDADWQRQLFAPELNIGLVWRNRVLSSVIAASAGMAVSMAFKLVSGYARDPLAVLFAFGSFVAMAGFHVRLIPLVLVAGPLAMAWYWPRPGSCPPPSTLPPQGSR